MRKPLGTVLGAIAALLAVGCSSKAEDVLPAALVAPKNAVKVVAKRPKSDPRKLSVSYEVREAYPAERFITELRQRVEAAGFKPMADDAFDARYEAMRKFRWWSVVGNKGEFFNWEGEWSNRDGDVVTYFLHCNSGVPGPSHARARPDNQIIVSAGLQPKRVVSASALPEALIVLDGARDVKAWRDQTERRWLKYEMAVRYAATAAYPPKDVMARLTERLEKQGWTWKEDKFPAALGFLSKTRSWTESKQTRGQTRGMEQQFVWEARWNNPAGDELGYVLTQFALPPSGKKASAPDSDLLEIEASLLSKREIGRP